MENRADRAKRSKSDFSQGPMWKCIVAQAVPLTFLLPAMGLGTDGVFLAEPLSNLIGGVACYAAMRMTVYKRL